ncbi:MAG: ABC transporter ATP-binding protein [Armatimonadetes bacterium]|nr:ABC transporter ATP-binding protein [Armatimonadota bacterium]
MIEAKGLGKRFGPRWVFRRVEFRLACGSALVVTGPNGSGKSTLLKIAAGLEAPSEGSVESAITDYRSDIGYSALDLNLYPTLTGREHLQLAARMRGADARADELLLRAGLTDAGDKLTGAYSTGMRARLRLALAIQTSPRLLILDEPGASMDEEGKSLVESIVQEQRAHGALLLATNDAAERRFAEYEIRLDG